MRQLATRKKGYDDVPMVGACARGGTRDTEARSKDDVAGVSTSMTQLMVARLRCNAGRSQNPAM